MTRVVINGAKGRMGQALLSCAARMPELQVIAGIDVYRDSPIAYSFPTVDEAVAAMAPLHLGERRSPSYELGDRCPTVTLGGSC